MFIDKKHNRISYINGLKGYGITTVIFWHIFNGYEDVSNVYEYILKWITSFHMALFFSCAGYFFRIRNTSNGEKNSLKKKGKALLIPLLILGVVIGYFIENIRTIIQGYAFGDIESLLFQLVTWQLVYMASWFVLALIGVYVIQLVVSYLFRNVKYRFYIMIAINILLLVIGYIIKKY